MPAQLLRSPTNPPARSNKYCPSHIAIIVVWLVTTGPSQVFGALRGYEGFDLSMPSGSSVVGSGSGFGFAPAATWDWRDSGIGQALYAPGLEYVDPQGAPLATTGGAVRLQQIDTDNVWHRDTIVGEQRPEEYWISFLLRWDAAVESPAAAQTLFWTPDGIWDRGAVGIDAATPGEIRFIHGQTSGIVLEPARTHWLVARIMREIADPQANLTTDSAQLWVDPNLAQPDQPHAEYHGTTYLDSIRTWTGWNVKLEPNPTGSITLDEFRWGDTFRDVAPPSTTRVCDLNADLAVDAADAAILFANWAQAGGPGDCNFDAIVDAADAGMLFAAWTGDEKSPHAMPEPTPAGIWIGYCLFRSCSGTGRGRGSGKLSTGRTSRI